MARTFRTCRPNGTGSALTSSCASTAALPERSGLSANSFPACYPTIPTLRCNRTAFDTKTLLPIDVFEPIIGFSVEGPMDIRRGGQEILLNGLALVLVGLIWGLVAPHTPYPRLALGAHLQFEFNGLLLIVMAALLLKFDHAVGPKSLLVMRLSAWLTWPMALSEVANSWWGTKDILPLAARQAE